MAEDNRVLAGLRVFELSIAVAAPSCGRYLAYHGADVIRIEARSNPDVARMFGSAWAREPELADIFSDTSPYLPEMSAGKRSIGLELKEPAALEAAHRLLATSDIFLSNYTPTALAGLGMSYQEVAAVKPDIIYAGMTGFGNDDSKPYYPFRAFGPNQAPLVGLDELTGYPDQEPAGVATLAPPDYIGGLHAMIGILSALEHRDATGEGAELDISQMETTVAYLGPYLLAQGLGLPKPERNGNRLPWTAPSGVYPSAGHDNWLAISVENDDQFAALDSVVGLGTERWATTAERLADHDALDEAVSAWTEARSSEEAAVELQQAGVAAYPVHNHSGVLRDPHVQDRRWFEVKPSSRMGRDLFSGHPIRMSDTAPRVDRAGPNMGEDTRRLLDELGYEPSQIDELVASGAAFTDARPEATLQRPFDPFYEALGLVEPEVGQ